jgi:hypothetical protein
VRGGIAQRFGRPVRGERLRLAPLGAGAALSIFYGVFIIWSPGRNYPGALGPFSNATIVTCVLLVLAFVAALVVRGRTASILALAAAVAEIIVGIFAAVHPPLSAGAWEGPSLSTVILFAGLATVGGASFRQGRILTATTLLVVAFTATALVVTFVQSEAGNFDIVSTIMTVCIAAAVGAALVLLVRRTGTPRDRARQDDSPKAR